MTNNYVANTNNKGRKGMSMEEINHWFRVWGIIGKLRQRSPVVVPLFRPINTNGR